MKINVGKAKPVVQARPGDIAYFDDDYWLIGWRQDLCGKTYYFISLTTANNMGENLWSEWVEAGLTEYLESRKAVIYDGSKSKLDLVIKGPVTNHD